MAPADRERIEALQLPWRVAREESALGGPELDTFAIVGRDGRSVAVRIRRQATADWVVQAATQLSALTEALTACQQERDEAKERYETVNEDADQWRAEEAKAEAALTACRAQGEALRWLVHLCHGVGKAGGEPEPGEWEAATAQGEAALSSTPKEPANGK